MSTLPPISIMSDACNRRDVDFDGVFFVGVTTTGIFCRPSCPARPLPKNRVYFGSAHEAIRQGFRPCKRCLPLSVGTIAPDWTARLLEIVEQEPSRRFSDKDLPKLGIDPVAARRYFAKQIGMTFQRYCRARRMGRAMMLVRGGANLETVAMENGYDSLSGFRDAFIKTFGQPPRRINGECILASWIDSPVCPILIGATDKAIRIVEFTDRTDLDGQLKRFSERFDMPILPGNNDLIERTKSELAEYFDGRRREFSAPLQPAGTKFQTTVWNRLQEIPYGDTCSYEALAQAAGKNANACRAVGQANGRNPIAILIPCHRVVNKDGSLGGYGGGLWRKKYLLELERRTVG